MTRKQWTASGIALLIMGLQGCAGSPESRRDKYLTSGKQFFERKDYPRALLAFRNAAEAKPNDPEASYRIGTASMALGDLRTAVTAFRKTLELSPKHPEAQLKLAQIMANASEQDWLKQAEDRLKTLLESSEATPEMLNTLAFTELKLGKTDDAVRTLEKALNAAPQELVASIMLAKAKLLENNAGAAETVLIKACETAPNAANPRVVLGEFYQTQNKVVKAEAEFQYALKIDPKNGPALLNLARLQNFLGRKRDAEETFKRAASLDVKAYRPMYALFLFGEGRRVEAVREFERLAGEDPQDRLARTRLVAAYKQVGRSADAAKVLDKALKGNGKDADALLQRGELFQAAGKYSEAEADLNEVLRLKPESGELHYVLAKLHQVRGATHLYRQHLSEALQLNPYLLPVRLELVQHLLLNKESRAASDILQGTPAEQARQPLVQVEKNWALWAAGDLAGMRKGIDLGLSRERSADLLVQDSIWKLRAGKNAEARKALEEALNINPADIRALAVLNASYVAQKQNAMALQKVKEYASRQPQSAAVQEFLGLLLIGNGDRKNARVAFEAAKAADPKSVRVELALIQAEVVEGKLDHAKRRLEGIVSAEATNVTARLWLGNIEVMQGNHKAALDHFRYVVSVDSANAEVLNNLAYLLAEFGNQPAEALKYAQKARELAPDNAEYSDTLGWILYRKGLYPLAVKELERATVSQGNAVWQYHLAMAYAKAGDLKRGRATLQAALQRNPNVPEAKAAQELLGITKAN